MKLKNVHYEYRGNDTWRIYFKDYKECEAFENERSDGKKPTCRAIFTNGLGIRYYVEAKLTGRFSILRRYVKYPTNDYFSSDPWTNLVKKIEGADSDYLFDEIDLWYVATVDKCYFKICCMNGTWTDLFVKNMLNSQYGMAAQANGYSDTDTAYQGGANTEPSKEVKVKVTRYEFGNYSGFIDYVELSPRNVCDITTVHFSSRTMFWIDDKPYRFYDALKIFGNIRLYDILDVVPEYYEEPDTDELGRPFCKTVRITLKPSCVTVAAKVLEEIKPVHNDVGQGGFCVRRSCCGIGFGTDTNKYDHIEERIIFTVKNFCRGEVDIVKVSPWTNTFIGTNKENEKEYSWSDFKHYMGLLHANGSDIWDIEWEYDETCPMTGTEVADKVHLYLNPLTYKRLFKEKEKKEEPKQLLKNITDVTLSMTKVIGCSTLYYYNLYFDDKSDLKNVNDNHINGSIIDSVKGTYYIRVVSYNKELPKNISSATLVWDQEENRYSVEDFTIKGYRKDDKKVWLSTGSLWSNDDYLGRVKALTPPPVPYWMKQDEDSKIGFRQKDKDEVQKEIDEMTKRIYEKLEIKQVKDFDVDTAWHEYLDATETTQVCEYCEQDLKLMSEELAKDIKEENIMGTKFKYIENVKDIVEVGFKAKDSKTRYYRVYFEKLSDMKNFSDRVMRYITQDKDHMCYYYFTVKSCTPITEKYKTLYFVWDNDERYYVIDWDITGGMVLTASANFEMKMTAQLNDEQLKVWEAALGIGNGQKHKSENAVQPTKILIQGTATIIWWSDGTKTVVKCQKGDKMDPEKGIAMCVMKKIMGTNETHSNYLDFAKPAIKEYEAKQKAMAAARKKAADKKRRAAKKEEKGNGEA